MQFTSKRKGRGIIPALGSLALLLTGCTMPSSATDKQVELSFTYATSNNLESPFEVLAEKYMEANSHVNITLNPQPNDQYGRSIRAQLQAGNAADIIQTTPGRGDSTSLLPLAESGFLAPLGKLAKDHVPEGSELTFELDGDVYGQAMGVSATGLSVNTTALKASGVGEFPADFEALLENCQTVASDGRSLVALAGAAAPNVNMTAMSIAATRVYADTPDWNKLRLEGKVSFADSDGWRQTFDDIVAMKEAACFQGGAEGAGFDVLTGNLSSGSSVTAVIPGGNIREIAKVAQGQDFDV